MDQQSKPKVSEKDPVVVTELYNPKAFSISPYYKDYVEEIVIPEGFINSRIEALAHSIAHNYQERPFTIIAVMNQSYKVFHKLNEYLEKIYESGKYKNAIKCEFVRISSHVGVKNVGEVEVIGLDLIDVKNKEILIVETIVESGLSIRCLIDKISDKEPKDVKLFSLLIKENRTTFDFNIDWIGFRIPAKFVVGYGLDYNEAFRDLNHLVTVNDNGISAFKKIKKSGFR